MNKLKRRFIVIIIIAAMVTLGFVAGFYHQRLFGQPVNQTANNLGLLQESWAIINRKFNGSTDKKKLLYGAIKGSVESLDDPYSTFLDPSMVKRFDEDLQGSFEGIGAQLTRIENQIIIIAPLKDSPAESAGLKPKDKIMTIDGAITETMTLEEAIEKIRGQLGTIVSLTIIPSDNPSQSRDVKITRAKILVPSVTVKDNQIIVSQFGDDTLKLFKEAVKKLSTSNNQPGIILDLRNNPGGYLDGAIEMISLLVDEEVAVWQQDVKGKKTPLKTTSKPIVGNKKMVVLINKGSASAAEIVSGALQDYGRAKIIGETSFGKGSVQDLENLSDGSALKLTFAQWLTPKERQIDKIGIKPDIEIKDDEKTPTDEQLDRARQEL